MTRTASLALGQRALADAMANQDVPRHAEEILLAHDVVLEVLHGGRAVGSNRRFQPFDGRTRLATLAPWLDLAEVEEQLGLIPLICEGDPAAGPIAGLPIWARFHWLVAPRSTVIQTSPVHAGLCENPEAELAHLVDTVVRLPAASGEESGI